MSKDVVLKVENLSKIYRLGEIGTGTISHDLNSWWHRIRGKEDPNSTVGTTNDRTQKAKRGEQVWALEDINFEVKRGEVLGIIGKNGAGKSTLLKILSKITAPTTGIIKIRGRVASLLEVGTGMHPEMTGKENVYLNGTILGMTKKEIDSKFDEIMDFAGCTKYSDTPVKRYSSGMKVRLGFAVAAFLEPEILIVDEVLAVGDAEFQKKAIGKMQDISSGQGRTVLFVSHNMASIENLCNRSLLLEKGSVIKIGNTEDIINYYLSRDIERTQIKIVDRKDRHGNGKALFNSVKLMNKNNSEIHKLKSGGFCKIVIELTNFDIKDTNAINIGIGIDNSKGNRVGFISNVNTSQTGVKIDKSNKLTSEIIIKKIPYSPGQYQMTLYIDQYGEIVDWLLNAFSFKIEEGDFYGSGKLLPQGQGDFLIDYSFIV